MSEKTICTCKELKTYLRKTVSEKRYIHSLGVADTTDRILRHYGISLKDVNWNGFNAAIFCGLAHDLAREKTDEQIVEYCRLNKIELDSDEQEAPVLAHGAVSADMAKKLCGDYPDSWKKAICIHTSGDCNMDALAMALFCADFLEPSRTYLTDEQRQAYLSEPSLEECSYAILCDMINHWVEKGNHSSSAKTVAMKRCLEKLIGRGER